MKISEFYKLYNANPEKYKRCIIRDNNLCKL